LRPSPPLSSLLPILPSPICALRTLC
jgi:hypothetical protein